MRSCTLFSARREADHKSLTMLMLKWMIGYGNPVEKRRGVALFYMSDLFMICTLYLHTVSSSPFLTHTSMQAFGVIENLDHMHEALSSRAQILWGIYASMVI